MMSKGYGENVVRLYNLYHEILMDHYRNPRNRGLCTTANFQSEEYNPSCGDRIQFAGCIDKYKVVTITFNGSGCVISQATASLLCEQMKNKVITDILGLDKDFVISMIGMQLGPIRLKCALLPLTALQAGIASHQYVQKNGSINACSIDQS